MKFQSFLLSALSVVAVNNVHALTYSEATTGEMLLQGGSQSTVSWAAPAPGASEVYVTIPSSSTAKSATYRIYPKGSADTSVCSKTDAVSPCFEVKVNQVLRKGKLFQLKSGMVNNWNFSTDGFVSVLASKTAVGELVGVQGARFNQVSQTLKYTKISNAGDVLPDTATLGTASTDWGCTRDDNTGLIWEVKTNDKGLRDQNNIYSWYDTSSNNKGYAGLQDGEKGSCTGSACDTSAYVQAVNAQGLCGSKDWRLPTYHELTSILKPDTFPTIDLNYFPNTGDFRTWSSTTDPAYPMNALYLYFGNGTASAGKQSVGLQTRIRLVRAGM